MPDIHSHKFPSLYATLAAWTRVFPDIMGQFGWFDFSDLAKRKKMIGLLACVFPVAWAMAYLFIDSPVLMVLSGVSIQPITFAC